MKKEALLPVMRKQEDKSAFIAPRSNCPSLDGQTQRTLATEAKRQQDYAVPALPVLHAHARAPDLHLALHAHAPAAEWLPAKVSCHVSRNIAHVTPTIINCYYKKTYS